MASGSVTYRSCSQEGEPLGQLLLDPGHGPVARSRGLQAAPVAAVAFCAVRLHGEVADLGGAALGALPQAAIEDEAAPHPGAQGDAQQILVSDAGPPPMLSQGEEVGVVFQKHGPGKQRLQAFHQGAVVQGREVGGKGDAAFPGEDPTGDAPVPRL